MATKKAKTEKAKKLPASAPPRLKAKEHTYWEKVRTKKGRNPKVRPAATPKKVAMPPETPGGASGAVQQICTGRQKTGCLTVPKVEPHLDKKNFKYTTASATKAGLDKLPASEKAKLSAYRKGHCENAAKKNKKGERKVKRTGFLCLGTDRTADGECVTYANRGGRPTRQRKDGSYTAGKPWQFNLCKSSLSAPCAQTRASCVVQLIYRNGQPHLRFCTDKKDKAGRIVPVADYREAMLVAEEGCAGFKPEKVWSEKKNKKTGKMEPALVAKRRAGMTKAQMAKATAKGKPLTSYRLGGLKKGK